MNQKKLAALAAALLLGPISANATLVSTDYLPNSGDGWLTVDTNTGIEWLDVSLTANQTFDEVRTGSWFASGFRFATQSEVQTLFLNAGTPEDQSSATDPADALRLIQLLGPTYSQTNGPPGLRSTRTFTYGFVGTDFFGNDVSLETHPEGVVFDALLAKVEYIETVRNGTTTVRGFGTFAGGQPFSDEASPTYGSFLVRVPEPSTIVLFMIGLLMWSFRMLRGCRSATLS